MRSHPRPIRFASATPCFLNSTCASRVSPASPAATGHLATPPVKRHWGGMARPLARGVGEPARGACKRRLEPGRGPDSPHRSSRPLGTCRRYPRAAAARTAACDTGSQAPRSPPGIRLPRAAMPLRIRSWPSLLDASKAEPVSHQANPPWQRPRSGGCDLRLSRPPSVRRSAASAGRRRPARFGRPCRRCRHRGRAPCRCRSSRLGSARPGRCRSGSRP